MEAFSIESCIAHSEELVKDLYGYVSQQASERDAYSVERGIYQKLMELGQELMKGYFAHKGTGDQGSEMVARGEVFKRQADLRGKDYFSIFGKFKVPRTYYHSPGQEGICPLDEAAQLPERCYSYLLQEWMSLFSVKDSFEEVSGTLQRLLGLDLSASRVEVVVGETGASYEEFYAQKDPPAEDTEGEIAVMQFEGKGVPLIRKEAAALKARLDQEGAPPKKKEALVGVSYTVDPKARAAEEVARHLVYPERGPRSPLSDPPSATESSADLQQAPAEAKGKNIRRWASLARSKTEVMEEIIADTQARGAVRKRPLVVVMDGALHLWKLLATLLVGIPYVGVLDIIHVTQYLGKAAQALFGTETPAGKAWVYQQLLTDGSLIF